ncbi:MAG: 23S rRNA (uracil(1939)-C(5))-methyltransferase RlmD [Acidaminococcaceae bacterium]
MSHDKLVPKQTVEVAVTGLGSTGEGVGKVNGFTVFAHGGLPGETVKVKLETVKKTYAMGRVTEILKTSDDRCEPVCPIYEECGGCQLQHLSYDAQLKIKTQQVKDALTRIGHLKHTDVLPTLRAAEPTFYRNKMQFPVSTTEGQLEIGCFAAATHRVVNVDNCFIQKEKNNKIIAVVREWMHKYHISAYNEDKGTGIVRHVMGRVGVHTGDVMVVLVTATYDIPHVKELAQMLRQNIPGLKSFVQNINKRHTNVIMGLKDRVIYGKSTIRDTLGTLKFNISPQSFFQVNSEQAEKLYNKAVEFAALTGKEIVFDVYCGTGTISLFLAKHAKAVYGIEIVPPAITDARRNAEDNHCDNATFILGDAARKLPELLEQGIKPDIVLLDPPRAGCEERVLSSIVNVKPKRIVYVSCNPSTLARDLAYLSKHGYDVPTVQPVDMFPMTAHVECVALLQRVDKK